MQRVLLLYKDLNTKKLIQNRFEFAGFEVVGNYKHSLRASDFDLLVIEDDSSHNIDKSFFGLATIYISSTTRAKQDSETIIYLEKPFRPGELVLKAKILLSGAKINDINSVKKSA